MKRATRRTSERLGASIFNVPAMLAPYSKLRVFFHRLRGVRIGKNVEMGYLVVIDNLYPEKVIIEDNATITARCTTLSRDEPYTSVRACHELVNKTRIYANALLGIHHIVDECMVVHQGAKRFVTAGGR